MPRCLPIPDKRVAWGIIATLLVATLGWSFGVSREQASNAAKTANIEVHLAQHERSQERVMERIADKMDSVDQRLSRIEGLLEKRK